MESYDENSQINTLLGKQLVVKEAPEPSDVCYQNNDRTRLEKMCSYLVSYLLCGLLLVGAYYVVQTVSVAGSLCVLIPSVSLSLRPTPIIISLAQ
jgi:hypothetical protein